jgi:hypothetical protein
MNRALVAFALVASLVSGCATVSHAGDLGRDSVSGLRAQAPSRNDDEALSLREEHMARVGMMANTVRR